MADTTLRLIFMGTPDFAVPTLKALLAAGHDIAAVYTQPPRPAGRGHKLQPSPVHRVADASGIPVRTPRSLRKAEAQAEFAALEADAAVVVAYGLILPLAILEAPRLGCFNVHASLLPRWRGAAPIQRAIMAGDRETGITVMQMDEGLDTGGMLLRQTVPVGPETTAGSLHDELAALGGPLVVETLAEVAAGRLAATPQPDTGVTYAEKIDKAEARIDWSRPAEELDCHIRGLSPFPGAWFEYEGARVKVLLSTPADGQGEPGTVLDDALTVACGKGAIRLLRLQRAGKAAMDVDAFQRGRPIAAGTRLV